MARSRITKFMTDASRSILSDEDEVDVTATSRSVVAASSPKSLDLSNIAPNRRVMLLLKEEKDTPSLFTEMGELTKVGEGGREWRERARWLKFEEDVEEGGNRWSKPHVASLSLHSLFQLRSCLLTGVFIIDSESSTFEQLIGEILDRLVEQNRVDKTQRDSLVRLLSREHTHQYRKGKGSEGEGRILKAVRSLSEIGRVISQKRTAEDSVDKARKEGERANRIRDASKSTESMSRSVSEGGGGGNKALMKALPPGAEVSNVLVGEVDCLTHHICAFVRLKNATVFEDLSEVSMPTRFLFLLLGPTGHAAQFREIGRAISTLLSDDIFHVVAYRARNLTDILDGVDEFLDQVTVLPPGEWDPTIRIEPPGAIPSQERRKREEADQKEGDMQPSRLDDPALKRTGVLLGGLYLDIRRKAPFYVSDFTDALNSQCVATFCFMYFALLAPIVTFGGLLEEATHSRMAAMENIFGGALCGIIYHLFSGQPLTIIGSTGPCLVFETIVYDLCDSWKLNYLSFRFWIHVWTSFILFVMVVTDASSLVSYITRFTEEAFAMLIAVIFIYEALTKMGKIYDQLSVLNRPLEVDGEYCHCVDDGRPIWEVFNAAEKYGINFSYNDTAVDYSNVRLDQCKVLLGRLEGGAACVVLYDRLLMSILLMLGTFFLAVSFKRLRNGRYFPSFIRQTVSDFAVMIAIAIMTTVDIAVSIDTPKLNIPTTFRPTWSGRAWLIPPFNGNPWWTAPLALLPALLACILIFMDQQITTVIINRPENKLTKGCGYHLDLFVLSFLIFLVGLLGLPIYVAATVLSMNHVNSLRVESKTRAPGEVPKFIGVREQRLTGLVTFMFIGVSVLMTPLLGRIPMPVLYGVFLYMGISALGSIDMYHRILLLFMPMDRQPDMVYIRHVPITVIHVFTACQVACLAILWIVKTVHQTSILFPIMLVVIVGVRKGMEKCFREENLMFLDNKMPSISFRCCSRWNKRRERQVDDQEEGAEALNMDVRVHSPGGSGRAIGAAGEAANGKRKLSDDINISKEVNRSGIWKHVSSAVYNSMDADEWARQNRRKNEGEGSGSDEEENRVTINFPKKSSSRRLPTTWDGTKKSSDIDEKRSSDGSDVPL